MSYDVLKIKNQICFPLYVVSKEVIKLYKPYLDELHLTYTQYITLMVLWEEKEANVKELGEALYLDSGTLTPVLKRLEKEGYISRKRSVHDERNLIVTITEKGEGLQEQAKDIPYKISCHMNLTQEEAATLYQLLYKMIK